MSKHNGNGKSKALQDAKDARTVAAQRLAALTKSADEWRGKIGEAEAKIKELQTEQAALTEAQPELRRKAHKLLDREAGKELAALNKRLNLELPDEIGGWAKDLADSQASLADKERERAEAEQAHRLTCISVLTMERDQALKEVKFLLVQAGDKQGQLGIIQQQLEPLEKAAGVNGWGWRITARKIESCLLSELVKERGHYGLQLEGAAWWARDYAKERQEEASDV